MHYGIRITTEVYKNWIPIQYNTLLMPSLDEREKNSVYKTSTEQSA